MTLSLKYHEIFRKYHDILPENIMIYIIDRYDWYFRANRDWYHLQFLHALQEKNVLCTGSITARLSESTGPVLRLQCCRFVRIQLKVGESMKGHLPSIGLSRSAGSTTHHAAQHDRVLQHCRLTREWSVIIQPRGRTDVSVQLRCSLRLSWRRHTTRTAGVQLTSLHKKTLNTHAGIIIKLGLRTGSRWRFGTVFVSLLT